MSQLRILKIVLLALLIELSCVFSVQAGHDEDFSEMDLEQLLNLNIYTTSVLSAHIHKKSELMFGYNIMNMKMSQFRDGTKKISADELLSDSYGYTVAPESMSTSMQMFHLMYATSDQLTWIFMIEYLNRHMHHQAMADHFTTRSKGWGDTQIKLNYIFDQFNTKDIEHQFGLTAGLSLPTGSITERDHIPMNMGVKLTNQLPYAMQLGSGTYDPIVGISYNGMTSSWYWGAQLIQTARVSGHNAQGYHLGSHTKLNTWLHYGLNDNLAFYTQLNLDHRQSIQGQDKDLPAMMLMVNPMADSRFSERHTVNIMFGVNYSFTHGSLKGHRININFHTPIYQDVTGPQLSQERNIRFGWQLIF